MNKGTKKKTLRQRISQLVIFFVFVIGLCVLGYPTVSEQWNKYRQSRLIAQYDHSIGQMQENDFTAEWEKAAKYNETVQYNLYGEDVFSGKEKTSEKKDAYQKVLNIKKDGIMGYISIPKINQEIPIYHGTSDEVLQTGVGHIKGTNLPIGGENHHCVLAAHRGLPSSRLFTDIDQLKKGDKFYIHILGKVFAYEVNQIFPMVDKNDVETLHKDLEVREGEDLVTLFTCTPYGINSHRLLVQGHRIAYHGEDEGEQTIPDKIKHAAKSYTALYLVLLVIILAVTVLLVRIVKTTRRK